MPKLLSTFLQMPDDINRDQLLSKEIALKKIIVVLATILTTIILGFFVIPEISYILQIKSVINSELSNDNITYNSTNQETKNFLQKHHYQKVKDITEFQGSDGKSGYLVATLDDKNNLGIFISYEHFGPYLWNPHIISINHFPSNYYN